MSTLVPVACDLCGLEGGPIVAVENGLSIRRCARCTLYRVDPRPAVEAGEGFEYFEQADAVSQTERISGDVHAQGLATLGRMRPARGRLLDVGCGFGLFVEAALRDGWDAHGIDLGLLAVEQARARIGADRVSQGDLLTASLEPGSYDCIALWNVLEHVPFPRATIERARELLAEDGILLVRVPNMHFHAAIRRCRPLVALLGHRDVPLLGGVSPPKHLFGFTPAALAATMTRAGLEVREVRPAQPHRLRRYGLVTAIVGTLLASATALAFRLSRGRWVGSPTMIGYATRATGESAGRESAALGSTGRGPAVAPGG